MLHSVMFWNEPNNVSHWDSTIDPAWEQFAQMVACASDAVAAANPHVLRVLGGISPIDPGFIQTLYDHGLKRHLDVVAVHGFPLDWNLWQLHEWPQQIALIEEVSGLPVWVTEVGASSFGCEEVQTLGLRRMTELLLNRVERVYWYSLFDLPSSRMAVTRHKESEGSAYYRHFYFGLLREDGTPKDALKEFDPALGICQWIHHEDYCALEETVRWLRKLGVKKLRTGLSWADSHRPGAQRWFDHMMATLDGFELMVTLCFTPPSRGVHADHTSPPLDAGEYAYFAAEMVRRYS
jgi:beta-xylosidase